MTHSPTPTELLALKVANAALLTQDSSYDFAATIVFALGSAQLLQSPESAAELSRLRARVVEQTPGLETEQAALLAEMIGDVQPARVSVLLSLGEAVQDQRAHDHSSQNEDWYCTNLVAFMGERMAPVLRRLLNSEATAAQLSARVAELEALTPARYQTCRVCSAAYLYGNPCSNCEFQARMEAAQAARPAHSNLSHDLPEYPHA
ncbi:hypothetical protein [Streptomyces erythrochromogenes]|uniref:hypothetical protein n=1 Tax=Streptomyces erythrochromogenes TaxID=285574 RepID=UPI00225BDAC0|nr:hypothetical protein [Streptomyces erythrochromogenes]MCX5587610.1 hypothetical protein [Streptomyces erythrochromogenes]